jgi:hypothetical protein
VCLDLPQGEKLTLAEFIEKHGHEYKQLTEEEKAALLKNLQTMRENKTLKNHHAVRKVAQAASADIRTTMTTLASSSYHLPERAGYAMLTLGARTDYGLSTMPMEIVPPILRGFCEEVLGKTPLRIAEEMEVWLLKKQGLGGGSSRTQRDASSHDLKSQVADKLRLSFCEFKVHAHNRELAN